jgi:hypothetical protein
VGVELVNHPFDRAFDDPFVVDRLDILLFDQNEHTPQLSEVAIGALALGGRLGQAPAEGPPK